MSGNYDNVRGVGYTRFETDEEGNIIDLEEPAADQYDAKIDEFYYESYSGNLNLTLDTDDGWVSIAIPVKANKKWNEFAQGFPIWGPREE